MISREELADWLREHQGPLNRTVAVSAVVGIGLAVSRESILIGLIGFVAMLLVCWAAWPLLKRL